MTAGARPVVRTGATAAQPAGSLAAQPVGSPSAPATSPAAGVAIAARASAYMPVKRAADAVVAGTALVVLSPLLGLLWIAVRAGMGRPVLFRQERVTMSGRRFSLMKFRTMRTVDPARGWVTDEERLTRFGAWLRSTSLDELPSLWNILVGDMSVVGPRPLPTGYLPFYSAAQNRRHTVRAGLTGLAQASGRNSVPWDERFDLDQRYVLLVGPLIDLTILARTVRLVLRREGVVAEDAETTDFSGPQRTSRLRLVPVRGASGGHPVRRWEARTPADVRIARCTCVLSRPRADARSDARSDAWAHATLHVTGLARGADPQLVEDLVALLITHARAADARSAQIDASADDAHLLRALETHGFVPARTGAHRADPDRTGVATTVRLVTTISSLDEPWAEHPVDPAEQLLDLEERLSDGAEHPRDRDERPLDVATPHLSAGHPVDAPRSSPLASGAER